MEKKTINIDLDSLSMKKSRGPKKSKTKKSVQDLEIKPSNVRQLLLEKLKEYKKRHKTRKREDMLQSSNNTPSTSPHTHNIYEKYLNKLNEKNSENVNLAMNSSLTTNAIANHECTTPDCTDPSSNGVAYKAFIFQSITATETRIRFHITTCASNEESD